MDKFRIESKRKFMKKPSLLNNSGFSLVEVMLAAGLLGVVSVGTMQLMSNMNEGQRRAWQMIYTSDLISEVENALRNEDSCTDTLQNLAVSTTGGTTPVPQIRNAGGVPLANIAPGATYGSGGGALQIVGYDLTSTGANPVPESGKSAFVRLTYRRRASATGAFGPPNFTRDIPVTVVPRAGPPGPIGTVRRCYMIDMSNPACQALGGTFQSATGRCDQVSITGNISSTAAGATPGGNISATRTVTAGTSVSTPQISSVTGTLTIPSAVSASSTVSATGNITSSGNITASGRMYAGGMCVGGAGCNTMHNQDQVCPPARPIMVGISNGGTIMCGAAP